MVTMTAMATSTRKSTVKKKPGRPPKPKAKTSMISFAGERFHLRLPSKTEYVMRFGDVDLAQEVDIDDPQAGAENLRQWKALIDWTLSLFDRGDGGASRESSQRRMYELLSTGRVEIEDVLQEIMQKVPAGRQGDRDRPLG